MYAKEGKVEKGDVEKSRGHVDETEPEKGGTTKWALEQRKKSHIPSFTAYLNVIVLHF